MSVLRSVRLDEVAEVTVGHVGPMVERYVEEGVVFLRSQNVKPHGFDLADVKYIDSEFHSALSKSALRPGDVVTVRTGKPGTTAVIPDEWAEANCADLVITRPGPELDSRWLSYYLNSMATGYVSAQLVGAVQQHFNVGSARGLEFMLPSRAAQRAIAEVLGALDDKIAANTKLVASAESYSVALLGEFFADVPLVDLVDQARRIIDPQSVPPVAVAHFSLPAFDQDQLPEPTPSSEIKSAKLVVQNPSVLVSKLNPQFPRVWDIPARSTGNSWASTEFLVLEPRFCSTSVLWAILKQPDFSWKLQGKVGGTSGSHQRVKPADLLATEVIDPRKLSDVICDSITSLGCAISNARNENLALAATRDALLPALMSGRLTVRDAERAAGEVL